MSKQPKTNAIRIIAGQWRGRRLPVLNSPGLRPTTDRVRETVFNWLMHDITGARCLDLFAGSGALGLESLSRGAASVQFVESNREVARALQNCIELLQVNAAKARAWVLESDALVVLGQAASSQFDIVFLDPPFQSDLLPQAAALLEANAWLSENACIYVECNTRTPKLDLPSKWLKYKQAKAGQSAYYLYRRGQS